MKSQQNRRGLKKFGLRKCLRCKEIFKLNFLNFYHNNAKGTSGFGWYCKECHKIKNRKYYRKTLLLDRFKLLKKFNFTCQYCGRKAPKVELQIDHIFPVSKGGTNDLDNLTIACADCNIGKGNKI